MGNKHAGGHKYGQVGQPIYGNGARYRRVDKLLSSGAEHRLRHCEGQAHHDDGLQRRAAGLKTCRERGECMRDRLGIQSGTRAELCYAIHAEQNAIIQAAKLGVSIDGATLYCTHQPCSVCAKMIINAGIRRVVYQEGYPDSFSLDIFEEAKVQLERFDPENAPEINP